MAAQGKWAIGSMGEDAALACLSDRPQMLYRYFKQRFAQVSNPAMDSINERPVMALYSTLGAERNLLEETEQHARMIRVEHPVITDEELARLENVALPGFRSRTLSCLFKVVRGRAPACAPRSTACAPRRSARCASGVNILILSDRGVSPELAPIPMLLATGAVHHHLVRETLRTRCGIVCETGEAREVAHFALLIGYGAGAINPYLAFQTVEELARDGTFMPEDLDPATARLQLHQGQRQGPAQDLREDGDLDAAVAIAARRSSRPSGSTARSSSAASRARRRASRASATTCSRRKSRCATRSAFPGEDFQYPELDPGGLYQWRARGERHTFNPDTVVEAPDRAAPRQLRGLQGVQRGRRRRRRDGRARCAGCSASRTASGRRCRSRRWSPPARS